MTFDDKKTVEISRFLSFILRHQPDSIGLQLDAQGWADVDELLAKARRNGKSISRELLQHVVETNDKKRFTLSDDGQRIRAAQGHSNATVQITYEPQTPPATLYHGTASRFIAAIMREGLKPGSRHHVHLSADLETARKVGARHGKPVLLQLDVEAMLAAGMEFYCADNGVWLSAQVAPQFLQIVG